MSVHGELVQTYVSADEVIQTLFKDGLSMEESHAAAEGVQRVRAQWAVDAIAEEIGERVHTLRMRESELITELRNIRQELSFAYSIFKKSPYTDDSKRLLDLYDKQLSYNSELGIVEHQQPFKLILSKLI